MAFRKDGTDIPLHTIADICEYVNAGGDENDRKERRDEMARKYPTISRETITSFTAHIAFRIRDAQQAVNAISRDRTGTLVDAEAGVGFADSQDADTSLASKSLEKLHQLQSKSEEAREHLRKGNLSVAINLFGKAGDVDSLRAIADVYANQRPDIAARALLAAGRQADVAALIGRMLDGNRTMAKRITTLLDNNA